MSELTFLRPYWLLALIPAALLLWKVWRQKVSQSGWKSVIDPAFQPYLLKQDQASTIQWPIGWLGLAVIWLAAIIALSGPSWKQQPIAAQQAHSGSVILLDLSLSMYADDLSPNRLTRVQFKLTDLLRQNPDLRVGMVAYSGSAHIISPISDDNSTLLNLLSHLNPLIMPSYGADALAGFKLAQQLLQGAQVNQGHIIWVTDDVEANEVSAIQNLLNQHNIRLSVLAVGSAQGGAIQIPDYGLLKDDEGKLVQAPVPLNKLAGLARQVNGSFSRLQLDDSDLASLRPPYWPSETREEQDEKSLSQPLDYGVYLLWLLLPLAALATRRGWLLSLSFVLLIPGLLLNPTQHAFAADKPEIKLSDRWREMFLTGDQRGYQAWLQQDYLAAEREFNDPSWRGSSLYRQGRYQEAAEAFKNDPSAQGHYNRGNALAKTEQFEEAIQAYQHALAQQPDFAEAQHNLELIQKLHDEQQNQQNQPGQDQQPEQQPEQGQDQQPETTDSNQQAGNEPSESETNNPADNQTEAEQGEQSTELDAQETHNAQDVQPTSEDKGEMGEQPTIDSLTEQTETDASAREREQANQAWLNQIRDDPGLFLKRKFDYQYQQNPPANPQENKRKLW